MVFKTAAAGSEELIFPYREYLQYWEKEFEKRLHGLGAKSAFESRVEPDPRDNLLLDELRRSVEVMPLDLDAVKRLICSIKEIAGDQLNTQLNGRVSFHLINHYPCIRHVRARMISF